MNTVSTLPNNILYLSQNSNSKEWMKVILDYIARYRLVLYITSSFAEISPIIEDSSFDRLQLENLKFIEIEDMTGLVEKLFELHSWVLLPELVIVDLRSFIDNYPILSANELDSCSEEAAMPFFPQLAALIGALMALIDHVCKKFSPSLHEKKNCYSLLMLKEHSVHLSHCQIELIIDLYYYKGNAFQEEELKEVMNVIALRP